MPKRVLVVYKWATLGGVERILLNRGRALARAGCDQKLDVHFIHDGGGAGQFRQEIRAAGLHDTLRVVPSCETERYDLVISIDTPEVVDLVGRDQRLAFECHTAYVENRRYLAQIQQRVAALAVPSPAFVEEIKGESGDFGDRLCLVRNFVCLPDIITPVKFPKWSKRPVVHLGRMDKLKNVTELLDGARAFRQRFGDQLMLVLIGPLSDELDLKAEIHSRGLADRVMVLSPVTFSKTWSLYAGLAKRSAVFTSCSKGESFGLSAAEAIRMGIPVLLSDIKAHRNLVGGRAAHLYRLGDASEWADKLNQLLAQKSPSAIFDHGFNEKNFIDDWMGFLRKAGI